MVERYWGGVNHPVTEQLLKPSGNSSGSHGVRCLARCWGPGTGLILHQGHSSLVSAGSSEHGRSAHLSAHSAVHLPYSMIFTTKGLCLKNHRLLKKNPKEWIFLGRKLERDPKSSEGTARQALWVSLSHSLPEKTWATHRDHSHKSSRLFLPPKASITRRSSSRGLRPRCHKASSWFR